MKQYFFWMLFASGLGFSKVLALAQIMSPADLGSYVSVIGVAVLSSTLLSLGQIEGTTKFYPRLWLTGDYARITDSVTLIAAKLAVRFALATVLGAIAMMLFKLDNPIVTALTAGGIGLCAAYLALAASILRAAENADLLQAFHLIRNATVVVLAFIGGWFFGWNGAMVGDLVAAAATLLYAAFGIRQMFTKHTGVRDEEPLPETVSKTGGGMLYLANLLSSSTQLLDRGAINLILGAAAAGSYGIVALMFQVGQLVVNIFAQRAGPRVIKSARTNALGSGRIESVRKPVLGMAALSIAVACAMLAARALDLPFGFFERYQISWLAIVFGGGVCFMQIFGLLEFHLIAHDREKDVLLASAIATATMTVLFAAAWYFGLALEWFILAVLVARTLHAAILWRMMNDPRIASE